MLIYMMTCLFWLGTIDLILSWWVLYEGVGADCITPYQLDDVEEIKRKDVYAYELSGER